MIQKTKTRSEKPRAPAASILKTAWPTMVLFAVAVILFGAGFSLRSRPELLLRADIREHNRGVSAHDELLWAPLITSEESLLAVYPHVIEKAGESFEQADSVSTDKKVKSAALYNLGTLIGRVAFFSQELPGVDVSVAVTKLAEAIRYDPNNEDAKYNRELLERRLERRAVGSAGPGQGYSPGVINKGY